MSLNNQAEELPIEQSIGVLQLADGFFKAAVKLQPQISEQDFLLLSSPIYFLYCHGLELVFKAFLISQGITNNKLCSKKEIGHDLVKALKAAESCKSFPRFFIDEKDRSLISWINDYYSKKEFEYLILGVKSFPHPDRLQQLFTRIYNFLKPVIDGRVREVIESRKIKDDDNRMGVY